MKRIFFLLSLIVSIISIAISISANNDSKSNVVVIDAGHGGMDSGCCYGSIYESDINLEIALALEAIFVSNGYSVILTRADKDSLCDGDFIKKEDMSKRVEIVNNSNALFCISIHLNIFSDSKYRGAQVFYSNANDNNKEFASNIQSSICNILNNTTRKEALRDNIFLLNRVTIPCVLVECGFLSNDEERKLLINPEYQVLIAYSIFYGSIKAL